ncbi:MAG: hypothetical protein BGO26_00605 [Actinobacteria bacterium 69-20]|jgi:aryl-alcohol dehydrogenase-like predicted oxidoreductase|nr:aldo/keto reductase [Actinomycetota bacterium]OJV26162.1 MAG: hypothetical protein BGO26_00605 [Actinobacteria bacterium 69-20]
MSFNEILSEVPVPALAVGTMYFGTTVPAADAHRVLDEAFEQGARFFDTANNYAFWTDGGTGDESENCLGAWLAHRGAGVRDRIVLASKVGARPVPGGTDLTATLGLSPAAIRNQVTDSLRRLRTNHLDVLYTHTDDHAVPLAETLGTLAGLQQEGLIRIFAASNLTVGRLDEAIAAGATLGMSYQGLQQRFTYLVPDSSADLTPHVLLDQPIVQGCADAGMTMLGYSPLLSGAYTRTDRPLPDGYHTTTTRPALEQLRAVSVQAGLDAGQTVLAWMSQRPHPVIPVVGVSRPEHVRSAVRAVTSVLSAEHLARLDAARTGS